jgi:putative phosphoesterase
LIFIKNKKEGFMRFILVSDSHGNKDGFDKLIANEQFDYLFFLGDGLNDLGVYENLDNVVAVSGNCDFFSVVPNERVLKIGKFNILVTHGNRYGVKSGLGKLQSMAEKEGVDFVFFGHTHKPTIEFINNIYYINPGTFYMNSSGESCCMEVIISNDEVKVNQIKI